MTNLSYHVLEREGQLYALASSGRYLDKYRREDGAWKIADRHVMIDWVREDAIASEFPNERYTKGMHVGQKDETDFSYQFLNLLKRGERTPAA